MTLHVSGKQPISGIVLEGQVEIITDARGVPHVFAASDAGAYFGLGYASARDRFCEMTLHRLLIQGRVAEFFGADKTPGSGEFVKHDRKMRLCGYNRLAKQLHASMSDTGRALLKAYADGVNHFRATQPNALHPYFTTGVKFRPLHGQMVVLPNETWEPWDSIAMWLRISRLYSDAEGFAVGAKIVAYDTWVAGGAPKDPNGVPIKPPSMDPELFDGLFPPRVFDAGSAPVQEQDPQNPSPFVKTLNKVAAASWLIGLPQQPGTFDKKWYCRSYFRSQYVRTSGGDVIDHDESLQKALEIDGAQGGSFSHAWAAAGDGQGRAAVLVGDPRIAIRRPSEFYEASMHGATLAVRGVCIPGSPNFLAGSNPDIAWSPTKADLQQADLFEVTFDALNQTYAYGTGQIAPKVVAQEDIHIRGGAVLTVQYRLTEWGPLLTEFDGDSSIVHCRRGKQLAVCWAPRHANLSRKEPTEGFLELYRLDASAATGGKSIAEVFRERLGGWNAQNGSGWTWPGVNLVFAASDGSIGYALTGAFPIRSMNSPFGGLIPQDGASPTAKWEAIVPPEHMPWVCKLPHVGSVETVHSANQVPVDGTWYPIPLVSFGGDTIRSRRLRERLATSAPLDDLAYVYDIHEDRVWSAGRDLATLGVYLRDNVSPTYALSADALDVLTKLGPWRLPPPVGSNAECVLVDSLGQNVALQSAYARWVGMLAFRRDPTKAGALVDRFGAGEAGLNHFLRKQIAAIGTQRDVVLPPDVVGFVDRSLAYAKAIMLGDFGSEAALENWFVTEDSMLQKLKSWDPLEFRDADDPDGTFDDIPPTTITNVGPMKAASDFTILSQRSSLFSQRVTWGGAFAAEALTPVHNAEQSTAGVDPDWFVTGSAAQSYYPSPLTKTGLQGPTSTTILQYSAISIP